MTIEQIKILFPPGTVFYPAHLSGDSSDKDYITVKEGEGFEMQTNGTIQLDTRRRDLPWVPVVYHGPSGKVAQIISKPKETFPSNWKVDITPEILDIVNDYRRRLCGRQDIKYPEFSCMGENGCGYRTSSADIDTATFIKIAQSKGINVDSFFGIDNSLLYEAERRYPVGTTFRIAHYEEISAKDAYVTRLPGEKFIVTQNEIKLSNGNSTKNGHPYNESCYWYGKWAEVVEEPKKTLLPEQWKVKITDSNINLILKYREYKGTGNHDYSYPYLGYKGYGRKSDSSETTIDDAAFKTICDSLGILNNITEQDKPMMPATPDASNVINNSVIDISDYPKENKRTIPQVNLISVKQRTII